MQTTELTIRNILHEQCGVSTAAIRDGAHLIHDLDLDSLDVAELMSGLEKELHISIPDSDWHTIQTVQELKTYVQHRINGMLAYA